MTSMTHNNSQQVIQEDDDFDIIATERVTKTQPECPPWCQVSQEDHEAEAWIKCGSWFSHVRRAKVGGTDLMAMSLQPFEEQIVGDDVSAAEGQTPGFFIDVSAEDPLNQEISASQAIEAAEAITRFVQEVTR